MLDTNNNDIPLQPSLPHTPPSPYSHPPPRPLLPPALLLCGEGRAGCGLFDNFDSNRLLLIPYPALVTSIFVLEDWLYFVIIHYNIILQEVV